MSGQASARPIELTDLLFSLDPNDGRRLPVRRDDVLAALEITGQRRAARLARRLPTRGDYLDAEEIDALVLRVHAELQRLGEELQLPRRLAEPLRRWAEPLLASGSQPVRVVDVGCGLGHVVRWLAAHEVLGPRVELVGVDLNPTLAGRGQLCWPRKRSCGANSSQEMHSLLASRLRTRIEPWSSRAGCCTISRLASCPGSSLPTRPSG